MLCRSARFLCSFCVVLLLSPVLPHLSSILFCAGLLISCTLLQHAACFGVSASLLWGWLGAWLLVLVSSSHFGTDFFL